MYASEVRSYRDLPIRFHEQTPLHRNEASGVLSGLTRVRQFSQDDGALLRDGVADRRGGRAAAAAGAAGVRDFGLKYPRSSSRRGRPEFLGTIETWNHAEAELKAALDARRRAVHDQRGRRRVLRPEDRLRRHRRHRPEVAVRHDPARLPDAGAVRPEIHRRRQRRAPAGRHPSCNLRQLRAVHRAADRALRRRVAAVAGPGSGGGAADFRPAPGLRRRGSGPAGRGGAAGRTGRPAGEDWL